jgi:hypothetical protein
VARRFEMRRTVVAVVAVLGLLASACGSRLSEEDRALAIAQLTGASDTTPVQGAPADSDPTAPDTGVTGPAAAQPGAPIPGAPSPDGDPAAPQAQPGEPCPRATSATDTGVEANKIVLANLADISGIQPGLFLSARQAAEAATQYINRVEEGICGRLIELQALDSRTDAGGNRAAMLDACRRAFAVVGSMSAFDDGSAAPGEQCGIPDITAITTNAPKLNASNTFPVMPSGGDVLGVSQAEYIKANYPEAIKKAAIIFLDQAVTRANARQRKAAWESVGFEFIYEQETQVVETGFARFVREMESRGVQYVTMVSDFQNVQRLQQAMVQQDYIPQVRDFDSVAYSASYLQEPAVEGSLVFINTHMFEEADTNPELSLYMEWLQRTAPGAVPDFFGLYAWSAVRLFQKLATEIGPDLTREKMLDALRAQGEWDGHGMHAPHRIGSKTPSTCNLYMEVRGGQFVRKHPASGLDCSGGLFRG